MIDDLVKNNEVLSSLNNSLKNRLVSPLYGTFIIAWILFHWKLVYTALFVSEDKIWEATRLLKSDYLQREFFDYGTSEFWIHYALTLFVTWLVIWILPYWLTIPAFRKEAEYKTAKRKIEIIEQRKLEEENVKKLNIVSQKVEKKRTIEKLDPTALWEEEYNKFNETSLHSKFIFIVDSIYKHGGQLSVIDSFTGQQIFKVPQEVLVYSHTNDLITLDKLKERMELTDKGKFFVKSYNAG